MLPADPPRYFEKVSTSSSGRCSSLAYKSTSTRPMVNTSTCPSASSHPAGGPAAIAPPCSQPARVPQVLPVPHRVGQGVRVLVHDPVLLHHQPAGVAVSPQGVHDGRQVQRALAQRHETVGLR